MKKKVVLGMSGGVDSSVAALLLKEKGYDVIGVTVQLCEKEDNRKFCNFSTVEDAKFIAKVIGIPCHVVDFTGVFKTHVINYFCNEYLKGKTPNPCIACNRYVKWEALRYKAYEIGAEYLATGHYARIDKVNNGRLAIKKSINNEKDQTYVLYNLTQDQLKHTLLPVGSYNKYEIRKIAEDNNLPVFNKLDSQDICFIPDHDYASFIKKEKNIDFKPGNFVDKCGNILGKHNGIVNYTIGQRKRLGLSLGVPYFVTEIKYDTNEVVIGTIDNICSNMLIATNINYMGVTSFSNIGECIVKIRYNHSGALAVIKEIEDNKIEVKFNKPQNGVAPGQAVVIYKNDYILGGGTIITNDN